VEFIVPILTIGNFALAGFLWNWLPRQGCNEKARAWITLGVFLGVAILGGWICSFYIHREDQ
jgi:membrane-associated phospholipid phosphatase